MHLRSIRKQRVEIPVAELSFTLEKGETLWTESSHKYYAEEVLAMAARTGYGCDGQWVDREWPFAQNLFIAE